MRSRGTSMVVALLVASCTGAGAATPAGPPTPTTTGVATTTTTAEASTATALPGIRVQGADPALTALVVDFYRGRTGGPLAPDRPASSPVDAVATTDDLDGARIAVVTSGEDLLAAIDEGAGWRLVGGRAPSVGAGPWFGGPRVLAVIGSDARPGEDPARSRADSIHLVAFDGIDRVAIVGIPRDSFVEVDGFGEQKLASALSLGGPDTLRSTLERIAGFELDGHVITGFEGFRRLAGQILGGINITLEDQVRDSSSGSDFDAGFQYMNGFQALAFARARKVLEDGDFGRQRNGGLVLIALVGTLHLRGPSSIPGFLAAGEPWLLTDLSASERLALSVAAATIDLASVANLVLPGTATTREGSSIVVLDPEADVILADLADARLESTAGISPGASPATP